MNAHNVQRNRRRARFGFRALSVMLGATVVCVGLALLADSYLPARARFDLTEHRAFSLSDRTRALIGRLEGPADVLVVPGGAARSVDPAAMARLRDLLNELRMASPKIGVAWIDGSASGGAEMFARLAASRAERVAAHEAAIDHVLGEARAVADGMGGLSDSLLTLRDALPGVDPERERLAQMAGAVRVAAGQVRANADAAEAARAAPFGAGTIPAADRVRDGLGAALTRLGAELDGAAGSLPAAHGAHAESAARARALAEALRDRALSAGETLKQLEPLDLVAVARLLESDSAVIVLTERAATAIPFSSLFQQVPGEEARFAGEELISTAIGAVSSVRAPVLVLVHSVDQVMLSDTGAPIGPDARFLLALFDRLRLARVDLAEWPVAMRPERPTRAALGAEDRPVVWVVIPSAAAAAEGAKRAEMLGDAARGLIGAGESVLLSVEPSPLPRVGSPDPMVAFLKPLGLDVDSGRPLLQRLPTAQGAVAWPEFRLPDAEGAHPIGRAVRGLTVNLAWPAPMTIDAERASAAGVHATALLTVPAGAGTWGESQWLSYRALTLEERVSPRAQPTPDPQRDNVVGPWIVAAALERSMPDTGAPQRVVVIGAHGWFFDAVARAAQTVGGRPVLLQPGNSELFDASVHWLAGLDDLIAPSPEARRASRIRPMDPGALTLLRWTVVLVPPLATLLLGVVLRAWRG
ncbi:MAG: hypothetical protein IBJ10_11275 [Phycisphaerales bacterium]|nr:hypothetical protein [Phycisphaerales bacterium]